MGGDWVDLADQKACAKIIGAKPITAAEASSPARAMGPKPPILSTSAVWEGLFPVPGHWAGEPSARRVPVSCSTRSAEPPRILPRPLLGYPPTRWCKGRPFVGSRISSSESPRNDIGFRIPSCDLGWTGQVYASVRSSDALAATQPRGLRHEGERSSVLGGASGSIRCWPTIINQRPLWGTVRHDCCWAVSRRRDRLHTR